MTTMDPALLSGMFQTVLDVHLENYLKANEILSDDTTGGNRRTVANAAKDRHGVRDDFARRVLDAVVREASPQEEVDGKMKVVGPPNIDLLFHLLETLNRVIKEDTYGKAVESYVASEVAKLKKNVDPERAKVSEAERMQAAEDRAKAYEGIESVRNLVGLSAPQFGQEAVDAFLAQIPDTVVKPRKPSGPTGPRLRNGSNPKAKYEFFDGTNNLGNQLSKVAGVLGAELSDIKDSIALEHVTPVDGEDEALYDERVKAWFNAAPDSFGFNVKGEKGDTRIRAVVTRSVEDSEEDNNTEE